MKKSKLIASSVVALTFVGLSIATTAALFSQTDKAKTVLTAGKIEVSLNFDQSTGFKYYSRGIEQSSSFACGGVASYDPQEHKVEIVNIAPGDKISFYFDQVDSSTIYTKMKTYSITSGVLIDALNITIKEVLDGGEVDIDPSWKDYAPGAADKRIQMEVEFPYVPESQDDYQTLSGDILLTVEAVQKTADVD